MQGRRRSETLDEQLLYTAVPVVGAGRTVGAVRVTQSVDALDREVRRDQYALVGIGALALRFGLAVAWFVAGSLARPSGSSPSTARRVGRGDLEARGAVEGSAEQQEVARAFNTMADRLTHALEAQREFVANASHQLRTPLTGLRLRLEAADMANTDPAVRDGARSGRGRDAAARAAGHEPAHARLGGRAGSAQRAGRPGRRRPGSRRGAGSARAEREARASRRRRGAGGRRRQCATTSPRASTT